MGDESRVQLRLFISTSAVAAEKCSTVALSGAASDEDVATVDGRNPANQLIW